MVRSLPGSLRSAVLAAALGAFLQPTLAAEPSKLRLATFNASLNRDEAGALLRDLATRTNQQARTIAAILQKIRPDVVLLNEFDHDPDGRAISHFQQHYLEVSQEGLAPLILTHSFAPPVNTGVSPNQPGSAPHDFDRNGQATHTPPASGAGSRERNAYGGDCFGFGTFPGQYGFVVLSRFPIRTNDVRTFQTLLWRDMPGAQLPDDPATPAPADWYRPADLAVFRLSSKTHADVPIELSAGQVVHVLASHPTPPVFDGPEDRNGRRNHDEIRFWADFIRGDSWMKDDIGVAGGLPPKSRFVILGDLNADPFDGDSFQSPARLLLDHPLISAAHEPASAGAMEAARVQGANNGTQKGNPAFDTGDFADRGNAPGNLRIDYVLPSKAGFKVIGSGVFWPEKSDPTSRWVEASDHRLVWADVVVETR